MMNRTRIAAVTLAGLVASTSAAAAMPVANGELEDVVLSVVYSATDEDAQIIISGGSEEPIETVSISGPEGSVMLKAKFKDAGQLGQADFEFETPEPSLEDLEAAYPAGIYVIVGKTVEGNRLVSEVELSYQLLDAPVILFPGDGDTGVPVDDLTATWMAITDAEAIRLELEDEAEEVALKVDLPGEATSFEIPNGWLQPGVEYTLDIKAIGENGNQTVSDLRFITAE